jgi:hypothetical protein
VSWRKLGRVFCPENRRGWMRSHASNPAAEFVGGDVWRVYFSSRDSANRSSVGWVEVDLRRPSEILRISARPVVSPGPAGAFDDSGASMSCLVRDGGRTMLYYLGWNLGVTVPWRNSIGLAVRGSSRSAFSKASRAPIVDRSAVDPFSLSYPWVMKERGRWRMWYGSNLAWGPEQKDMAHVIKCAESSDGIRWEREGRVALGLRGGEIALSKPCVVRDRGLYRMWYSYRGKAYRIGYAESKDGVAWRRLDARAGLEPSPSGWDSRSVEYPCVFDHRGRRYMLYNGNDYGKTGFGLAVREEG